MFSDLRKKRFTLRVSIGIAVICFFTAPLIAQETGIPSAETFKDYVETAFTYGPFAFALLFLATSGFLVRGGRRASLAENDPALKA